MFRCFIVFVFHAKLGTTNHNWNGSSDISYLSPFNRDSNDIKKLLNFFQCREKPI